MSGGIDSEFVDVLDASETFVLLNQYGRIDLVRLSPRVNGQPYSVEKTLIEDIILCYNGEQNEIDGKGFMITRDAAHWVLDIKNGSVCTDASGDYSQVFENGDNFRDIY